MQDIALVKFVELWGHEMAPPQAVDQEDLERVERALDIRFPQDYKDQLILVGAVYTDLDLLSAIISFESELADLNQLFTPSDIETETVRWRDIGMPETLVAIGSDSLGNKFCFDASDLEDANRQGAPVWYWDHDLLYTKKVGSSFSDWIERYNDMAAPPKGLVRRFLSKLLGVSD